MTYGDFTGVGAGGPLVATFGLLEATVVKRNTLPNVRTNTWVSRP